MSLPAITETISDFGLGIIAADATDTCVKMGVCSGGTVNTVYQFSDQPTLVATLGTGPLVDAAALSLATAGGPVWCVPLNPSITNTSTISAITHVGTGTSVLTITGTPANTYEILVTVTTAVALVSSGTGAITYSLNGGQTTSAPVVIPTGGTYAIPGTGLTLNFTTSGSLVLADTYTANVYIIGKIGAVETGSTNTSTSVVTMTGTPADDYDVVVTVTTAATLVSSGLGAVTISLDGGNSVSSPFTVPGAGSLTPSNCTALAGTGITIAFTTGGTLVVGDTFTAIAYASGYAIADITAGVNALLAYEQPFGFIHLVGQAATTSAAVALFASVDTLMGSLATNDNVYTWCAMESPKDSQANIIAGWATAASSSRRMMVCGGTAFFVSPVTGLTIEQSSAWAITARCALITESEDPGNYARGPVAGIPAKTNTGQVGLVYDERVTPGLDNARIATLRTFQGQPGFYVTRGRMMSPNGSDFWLVQFRRVMDLACRLVYNALLPYLNSTLVLNANGTIAEAQARAIEAAVNYILTTQMVTSTPQQASGAGVRISRTANISSTSTLPVTVTINPLGYAEEITVTLSFQNSALSPAA